MDPLTNIISSAVGTIVGAVAGFFQAKQELEKRRLELAAEEKRMAHEHKMALMNADVETQKGEASAFVESLKAGQTDGIEVPANAPTFVQIIATLAAAFRTSTRPGVTWYSLIAANYNPNFMPLASTCVGWWFGQRGARYFNK